MVKQSDVEAQKKRVKVQQLFWNQVGAVEHINLPKLEDALRKEFKNASGRFLEAQVGLMQTEGKIKVESRAKVWIKQPEN